MGNFGDRYMRKQVLALTAFLSAAVMLTGGLLFYYQRRINAITTAADTMKEYDRHYMFVSSDQSEMLMNIFDAAKESADAAGAYLEWCDRGMDNSYTAAQCVDIAIAAGADGIVVYPDGSAGLDDAIMRASSGKIPVVTILRDMKDTKRVSYVGVSGYQIGELYGGRLISLLHDGDNDVCLLEDTDAGKEEAQLLYTQMIQAVNNGAPSGKRMHLRTEEVDNTVDFDAEQVIRNLLLSSHIPDILICMDPVQTECAIQALLDYNLVGDIQVIGYYATTPILYALRQELIPVTMTIDTSHMGRDCIQALDEYRQLGRVNDYYNIVLDSITPTTVKSYIDEHGLADRMKEEAE